MAEKMLTALFQTAMITGTLGIGAYYCLYNVDGGERAVMFNRFGGVSQKVIGEGTHFRIPWFQTPFIYDIRTKPKTISTTTGTKDMQTISISLRLLYKPIPEALPQIHKTMGYDYDERVLPSIGNEILKAVVAQYNAEQLLTIREKVSGDIRRSIIERAAKFNIALDDVAITHLQYGKEFSRAIEEKQVAEQEAERSKFVVAKAEQERQAAVITAEGEAEAALMISNALKEFGTGLIDIRRIDAAKDIAETLAKSKNVTYVPGGQNLLLNINAQ
eukprot:Platyproteum_vivax@DN5998_c0_g1_i2.p1